MGEMVQVRNLLHGGTTTIIAGDGGCNFCGNTGMVYPKCPACGQAGNSLGRVLESAWQLREQLAASQREREQLQARVDAAEKLAGQWLMTRDYMMNQCAKSLKAALSPAAAPVQAEGEK